ncbi:MAG: amidohydrolase, partial [Coleofasciculus sp. S288]|nr:amidohydrolase [Coleofasciculus sp. S288]
MVSTFPIPHSVDLSQIRLGIRALQPQLVEWRRRLHQRPELGFKEQLTAQFIGQKLEEWGIAHQSGIAKTGIVATIASDRPGPVL